jgi:hypothetical protein
VTKRSEENSSDVTRVEGWGTRSCAEQCSDEVVVGDLDSLGFAAGAGTEAYSCSEVSTIFLREIKCRQRALLVEERFQRGGLYKVRAYR